MCRSTAEGGRRCPGRGGHPDTGEAPATATATAVAEPPRVSPETVSEVRASEFQQRLETGQLSRDEVDELAAKLPADRTSWDKQPLDERGRRFFALREAGWTGPIDQDGYPATSGEAVDTLRYMAAQRGESVAW